MQANSLLPKFLGATVGDYRPQGSKDVRITRHGCVVENDMQMLDRAQPVTRKVLLVYSQQRKQKVFTRLLLGKKFYLADRVTGTLYAEASGRSSSHDLRLV